MDLPHLSPTAAHEQVAAGALLLDVREDGEWQAARFPGAVHAPLSRFMEHVADLPKDRPIVVACAVGGRSVQAAAWLKSQGYDASNLSGGLNAWHAAGLPVEQ